MDDDQQFCLRWNNHQSTLISVFDTLLEKGIHVDCTLAAEGQTLKAHKVVLSACSPYFESVLSQQYDKHPIIILKDVKYAELRAMMDYMYRGEVNISQDQLAALLKAAESLQIKGLSDNKPPPRTSSPSLKGRVLETASTGHLHSREGSSSPAPRKRKKPRRASADSINISSEHIPSQNHTAIQPPVPIKNNIEHIENDIVVPIKVNKVSNDIVNDVIKINNKSEVADDAKIEFEEGNEDSVEDLTLDEEADSEIDSAHQISAGPSIGQGDVVQSFQWHMERSQDEVINTQDSQRDSQDASVLTLDSNKEIKSLLGVPVIDLDLETSLLDEEFDADESDSSILQFSSNKKFLILKPDDEELKHLISDRVQNNLIPSLETKTEDTVGSGLDDSKENDKIIINEAASEERGESKKGDTEASSPPQPSLPCAQYATPKGYKCPNCQRIYNARKNLVRHINLECGREPQYRCPYCSHGNHRRNELKRHIQKKHPDKPDCDVPPKVAC